MQEIVDRMKAAEKTAEDQKAVAVKAAKDTASDAKGRRGRNMSTMSLLLASEEAGQGPAKAEADSQRTGCGKDSCRKRGRKDPARVQDRILTLPSKKLVEGVASDR